ncbi:Pectin lyase fold [Phytophthora cactorum]|nr:Pectin lyase fold [Phytophthora cactorum]
MYIYVDRLVGASSASTASSSSQNPTQASSASTDSSVASSASTASSSSQNPTQASSSSTTSSASASYQASSNSSTDASEADAPGTVAPVENGSFEQSVVSSDASQTQQQDATEEPTATPSVSSSGSGSLYSSSDDVSQTAVQQSMLHPAVPMQWLSQPEPGSDSITQSSGSDSVTQNTGSGSATQTATNSTGTVPDGSWPASTGTVQYSEAYIIKAGEVFDGKMQTFRALRRLVTPSSARTKWRASTAISTTASLRTSGGRRCEDALSIKGGTASSVSKIIGGGARYADDKVIQHNGYGTVEIDGFYGEDISKLYRSCGTCGDRPKKVSVSNSYIVNPGNAIVTVNKNWGDEATLKNVWVKSSKASVKICQWSQGNANGEPKMLGNGPSPPLCQYSESDVHINEK